jgi:hypothetical protein
MSDNEAKAAKAAKAERKRKVLFSNNLVSSFGF